MDKKLWYIYTKEYYSAIKRKVTESVSSNEVDEPRAYYTEEVIQKEKDKYRILEHTYGI